MTTPDLRNSISPSPLRGGLIFICFALALVRLEAGSSSTNQFSGEPGTLTFTDVSVEAGFFGNNSSWAAAWGDYDDDGNVDVMTLGHVQAVTNLISQLWHNNGDETFTDVTVQAGLNPHNGDAHGAVWSDFDSDGYLARHCQPSRECESQLSESTCATVHSD